MSSSRASLSTEYPETNSAAPPGEPTAEDGYPSLARLMHAYPDNAILRRFDELNLLHLLRIQAELQDMENTLKKIREEDEESRDVIRVLYVKDFRAMRDGKEDGGDSEQYDLLVEIGKKLQEYSIPPLASHYHIRTDPRGRCGTSFGITSEGCQIAYQKRIAQPPPVARETQRWERLSCCTRK